jgi:hypothetical protein
MTLQRPVRHERRIGRPRSIVDHIVWEPHLAKRPFRRAAWEQATIVEVSVCGARVLAHANDSIVRRTRVSIGLGKARGLVEVRHVEPAADDTMALYSVQFLWLDTEMQSLFDNTVAIDAPTDLDWRWRVAT